MKAPAMRDMIIASTSTLYGQDYLQYLMPILDERLSLRKTSEVLFIPCARPGGISHDEYTARAGKAFKKLGLEVTGLHNYTDSAAAIQDAQAIFTGGGNTFVLVKTLHDLNLMSALRKRILDGAFYLGTSAGSNICGLTMGTTNDMPVVRPTSYKTTGVIAYNINAHYTEPVQGNQHMGESRETRIKEFHVYNSLPVVGLREGSFIDVQGDDEILSGELDATIFEAGQESRQVQPGYNFNQLNK